MDRYVIRDGVVVPEPDIATWGRWMQAGNRHVAKTNIGEAFVSTVFLGMDHAWGDGPPVLWETMVFGGELDQEQDRYTSEDDARKGHKQMVQRIREAQGGTTDAIARAGTDA